MGVTVVRRAFIVLPNRVEEINEDGEAYWWPETSLYDDLVLAGYPITNDTTLGGYYIDCSINPDGTDLEVYTQNPGQTHDMGPAAEVFIAWYRLNGVD